MEYMESKMQDQIEGAQSENDCLRAELRSLKLDNGLLKLTVEQLAHNYKMADNCAHEREGQLLAADRLRDSLLEALEVLLCEEKRDDDDPILDRARINAHAAIAKAKGAP